jgi:hypothetical protein
VKAGLFVVAVFEVDVFPDAGHEVGFLEIAVYEGHIIELRAREVGVVEIGVVEIADIRPDPQKIGMHDVGAGEITAGEGAAGKHTVLHVSLCKGAVHEVGVLKKAELEVRPGEIDVGEVPLGEIADGEGVIAEILVLHGDAGEIEVLVALLLPEAGDQIAVAGLRVLRVFQAVVAAGHGKERAVLAVTGGKQKHTPFSLLEVACMSIAKSRAIGN